MCRERTEYCLMMPLLPNNNNNQQSIYSRTRRSTYTIITNYCSLRLTLDTAAAATAEGQENNLSLSKWCTASVHTLLLLRLSSSSSSSTEWMDGWIFYFQRQQQLFYLIFLLRLELIPLIHPLLTDLDALTLLSFASWWWRSPSSSSTSSSCYYSS